MTGLEKCSIEDTAVLSQLVSKKTSMKTHMMSLLESAELSNTTN